MESLQSSQNLRQDYDGMRAKRHRPRHAGDEQAGLPPGGPPGDIKGPACRREATPQAMAPARAVCPYGLTMILPITLRAAISASAAGVSASG